MPSSQALCFKTSLPQFQLQKILKLQKIQQIQTICQFSNYQTNFYQPSLQFITFYLHPISQLPFILCLKFINKDDIVLQYLSCRFLLYLETYCMKGTTIRSQSPYLDISQYLLKEHSPYFKPKVLENHQISSPGNLTPEISPIRDGLSVLVRTPLARSGVQLGSQTLSYPDFQDFNQFSLEGNNFFRNQPKSKKIKKINSRPRLNSTWHHVDIDLQKILEENDKSDEGENIFSEDSMSEDQDNSIEDYENSDNMQENKQNELEKQSTTNFDLILNQEPLYLEWHHPKPKQELIKKLKTVCSSIQPMTDEQKIENLKSSLGNYAFEHEKFYFQESMNQLNGSIQSILSVLIKGIDQAFNRNVGGLTFEQRRKKLVKYMEKKRRRVWRKKVNYDCRKKVADGRLRIKGKFVTYEQAREQLGMSSLEGYNADEIRNMIEKKSDNLS